MPTKAFSLIACTQYGSACIKNIFLACDFRFLNFMCFFSFYFWLHLLNWVWHPGLEYAIYNPSLLKFLDFKMLKVNWAFKLTPRGWCRGSYLATRGLRKCLVQGLTPTFMPSTPVLSQSIWGFAPYLIGPPASGLWDWSLDQWVHWSDTKLSKKIKLYIEVSKIIL